MFRATESAFTRNLPTYEKTCDVVTFTIIINLSYFKIVIFCRSWQIRCIYEIASTYDPSRYPPLASVSIWVTVQGWVSRRVVSACDLVNASYLPTTTKNYDLEIR